MSNNKVVSNVLTLSAILAGAYHGFCDGSGTPIEREGLEAALTYGPAVARGVAGSIGPGAIGLLGGSVVGGVIKGKSSGVVAGGLCGTLVLGGLGFGCSAIRGGFETVVSYAAGYVVGKMIQ